jgi:hypothetical protein
MKVNRLTSAEQNYIMLNFREWDLIIECINNAYTSQLFHIADYLIYTEGAIWHNDGESQILRDVIDNVIDRELDKED